MAKLSIDGPNLLCLHPVLHLFKMCSTNIQCASFNRDNPEMECAFYNWLTLPPVPLVSPLLRLKIKDVIPFELYSFRNAICF